ASYALPKVSTTIGREANSQPSSYVSRSKMALEATPARTPDGSEKGLRNCRLSTRKTHRPAAVAALKMASRFMAAYDVTHGRRGPARPRRGWTTQPTVPPHTKTKAPKRAYSGKGGARKPPQPPFFPSLPQNRIGVNPTRTPEIPPSPPTAVRSASRAAWGRRT